MKTRKTYIYDNYETQELINRANNGEEISPYEWTRISRNWGFLKCNMKFVKRFIIYINWKEILQLYRTLESSKEYKEIFDLIFKEEPVNEDQIINDLKTYKLPKYEYLWFDKYSYSLDTYKYARSNIKALFCEYNLTPDMYDYIMENKNLLKDENVRRSLITTKILFPDKRTLEMLKIISEQKRYQILVFDMHQEKLLNSLVHKFFKEFNLDEIYKILYDTHNLTPESKGLLRAQRRVLIERMEK